MMKSQFFLAFILVQSLLNAQTKIFGTIKDSENVPINEVNIEVRGFTKTILPNQQGYFSIDIAQTPPFVIRFSRRGFKNQEIKFENENQLPLQINLAEDSHQINAVVITARRKEESAQEIPIPVSIVRGATAENSGAFNVNRLKEIVPSVQLYSSNPRNTTLNIRGMGSTFGLTNDGIEPGVGFYMDGVYYARPAVTALDFVDVEQIEVLRGPQGTLFGKNTTAGAFNITSRAPSFTRKTTAEISYGNYNYLQGKFSVTGAISKRLAGRISFSGTTREGLLYNVRTDEQVNSLNNLGFRGQLLYTPWDGVKVNINADYAKQNPIGYAQVYAGKALTQRPAYRQFDEIIKDLNYQLPSTNPFDRKIDTDTPWKAQNEMGGTSLNIEAKLGRKGTINAITAWRFWNWNPSNDRDYLGLNVLSKSEAPSKHQQWTQEIRYSGKLSEKLNGLIGFFAIYQSLKSNQVEESGTAQ